MFQGKRSARSRIGNSIGDHVERAGVEPADAAVGDDVPTLAGGLVVPVRGGAGGGDGDGEGNFLRQRQF